MSHERASTYLAHILLLFMGIYIGVQVGIDMTTKAYGMTHPQVLKRIR